MTKTHKHRIIFCALIAALLRVSPVWASSMPECPDPPKLVNDFAGVLGDTHAMEDTLEKVALETSNQIVVVTVSDLLGLEAWDYAVQLGRKWGVGGKEHNNGVVLLVKPGTGHNDGRVTIQVGYGLEGVLPDGFCSGIVQNELLPKLGDGQYSDGVWAALNVIIPVVKGEYNEKTYNSDRHDEENTMALLALLVFFGLLALAGWLSARDRARHPERYKNNNRNGTWGGPIIMGGGGSSWGSSGGGIGFGGFGGGSFGGGGASGSF